jgi:hypothetical protein
MFDGKHNSQQVSTACAIADLTLSQDKKLSASQPYPAAESRDFYESDVVSTNYQQLLATQSPCLPTITSIEEMGLIIKQSNLFCDDHSDFNLRGTWWGVSSALQIPGVLKLQAAFIVYLRCAYTPSSPKVESL